jgi:ribosome-associated protein YbcJ (S4-like RNA binding protein)
MAFVTDAHLAEGQVLTEGPTVNKEKSHKLRVGTLITTESIKVGQILKPL